MEPAPPGEDDATDSAEDADAADADADDAEGEGPPDDAGAAPAEAAEDAAPAEGGNASDGPAADTDDGAAEHAEAEADAPPPQAEASVGPAEAAPDVPDPEPHLVVSTDVMPAAEGCSSMYFIKKAPGKVAPEDLDDILEVGVLVHPDPLHSLQVRGPVNTAMLHCDDLHCDVLIHAHDTWMPESDQACKEARHTGDRRVML